MKSDEVRLLNEFPFVLIFLTEHSQCEKMGQGRMLRAYDEQTFLGGSVALARGLFFVGLWFLSVPSLAKKCYVKMKYYVKRKIRQYERFN